MLSREQVLRQIRRARPPPGHRRELLQVLRVPRHERQTFRRLLKALVADGDLLQIRGNRFGLADRMDVVVGRLQMHQAGYGFVVADGDRDGGDLYIAPTNVKEALHGDRVVARVEHQRGDRAEGRIIRILERGNATRSSAATRSTTRPWASSCRSIGACSPTSRCRQEDARERRAGRHGRRRADAMADGHPSAARAHRRSARPDRHTGRRHADHHPQARAARRARRGCGRRGDASGHIGAPAGHRGPDRFPIAADRDHRRRARARLRRRHHARAAGERALLARRAHRRRLALRRGRQRPRRRGLRARHLGLLSRARDPHVSGGAGHRTLLAASRTSTGWCSRA